MTAKYVNELRPEFLGIHAMNPFAMNNSASRGFMFSSHFTQHLVTNGLQERIIYAGPEQEFAKYSLGVRMPADGRIIKVIEKYPPGVGKDSLNLNPESLVIYENVKTREIDCFVIPRFRSFHQYFGWQCEPKEGMDLLRHSQFIPKDTMFVDTPGVKDGNSYMYGRNVNVAYMSIPGVSEDGIAVSRSELENWKYRVYETRVVEWGSSTFPVNIYGKDKPFPDIGEYIRQDGLLMALRKYRPESYVVDMGINDIMEVDHVFDKPTYVRPGNVGNARGRVVDIEIISNNSPTKNIPLGMTEHTDKYVNALLKYYHQILQTEEQLRIEHRRKYGGGKINISPAFNKILVRALAITNYGSDKIKQALKLIHRRQQIDEYYAKFVIEYEVTPNMGDKLSNCSGSKGVICEIIDDDKMPVRPDGVRADMIIDPGPVFNRMNIGQSYEQYMTCACYDVAVRITHQLGLIPSTHSNDFQKRPEVSPDDLLSMNRELFETSYDYLTSFYKVFNQTMFKYFSSLSIEDKAEHLSDVINEGTPRIFLPCNNERLPFEIVNDLERDFNVTYTPVRYTGPGGVEVETAKKVRIGAVYMFLLDKPASEWSSSAAARLQHFGILSSVTKSEKFANPFRNSPTRISGETETRIFACYTGARAVAEMFDRTNNPVTRRNIYWNLLDADVPSRMKHIVDRNLVPLGASRPIQILNHILQCAGLKPEYLPEVIDCIQKGKEDAEDQS